MKLFDEIPRLEDGRILLRRMEEEDLPPLRRMIDDPRVYRYLPTFLFEAQYDDLDEMLRRLYGECFRAKESLILSVVRIDTHEFCGLAEFYGFKDALHKTCLGYRFAREHWGQGIATRTVALMTDYLFGRTDTEIITASTMVENKASACVLEHNGFIRTASAVPEDWGYPEPTTADKWFR